MDSAAAFDGHLRKIAEAALPWTPRLVSMKPRTLEGRTVVYLDMDACSSAVFLQLIRLMEDFCRREAIPPDYRFSYQVAPPGAFVPGATPKDLPTEWPPAPE